MYPYKYRPDRAGINFREVFVVIPYEEKFEKLYNNLITPAVELASKILRLEGHQALYAHRARDDIGTSSGWLSVLEHLYTAQIVLGVLTDSNANVYYELGIAHATQPIERQVLLLDAEQSPPFDLKDLIHFDYHTNNLKEDVEPFSKKIAGAISSYKIAFEIRINKARMLCGPYEFEIMMDFGEFPNFTMHTSSDGRRKWGDFIRSKHGDDSNYIQGCFERHAAAISNLCQYGLLGLNTSSVRYDREGGVLLNVQFSYHWTDLGNCVLSLIGKIEKEEVTRRRNGLPAHFY